MKKCIISLITCFIIVVTSIVPVTASGGIVSAKFNSNKIILDGRQLNLGGQQMISIMKEGEERAVNYAPVRSVLQAMGYKVEWDSQKQAVIVSSSPYIKNFSKTGGEIPTNRPAIEETIEPTAELLNGSWSFFGVSSSSSYDDDYSQINLKINLPNNNEFEIYMESYGMEIYFKGTYSIESDSLSAAITYMEYLDEKMTLEEDEIEELTIKCRFSKDGSSLYLMDDYDGEWISFVKDTGSEFSGKAEESAQAAVKFAEFNSYKIILDGKELDLGGQQMVSIIKEGEWDAANYIPLNSLLNAMDYEIKWDGIENAVVQSPTKELLNGYWTMVYTEDSYYDEGDIYELSFDADGNFGLYSYEEYWEDHNYIDGLCSINKDNLVLKFSYQDYYSDITTPADDDMETESYRCWFSEDGNVMYLVQGGYYSDTMIFKKSYGTESKKYLERIGRSDSAQSPSKELLNGYWSMVYTEDSYYDEGDIFELFFNTDGKFEIYYYGKYWEESSYISGTYLIDKNIITLTMTYYDYDDEAAVLTGEDIETDALRCWFSEDGSIMYLAPNGYYSDTIIFKKGEGTELKKHQK